MRSVHRESDDRVAHEHGTDERDIREVRAAAVRIVEDDLIPLSEGSREVPYCGVDRNGHRTEVDRDVFRLGDDASLGVEECTARIHPFLDVRGVRGPPKRDAHLLRDERQCGLQDLQVGRIHGATSISMSPRGRMWNLAPGGTTVVA